MKYLAVIYFLLLASCTSQNLQLVKNGNLDTKRLSSLKDKDNKKISIKTEANKFQECKTITFKKKGITDRFCTEISYKKEKGSSTETKIYDSIYDGFKCKILEEKNYNGSSSKINWLEKRIIGLAFGTDYSDFELYLEKKDNQSNYKISKNSRSLRDVLIHIIKNYRFNQKKDSAGNFVKLGEGYDKFNVSYNNGLILDLKTNKSKNKSKKEEYKSNEEIAKILKKIDLKDLYISKHKNKWSIHFERGNYGYQILIDDDNEGKATYTIDRIIPIEEVIMR